MSTNLTDLVFPLLIGAGILIVLNQRNTAVVAPIDIAAAPDPIKCKAFDDAKVNSKLVGEPCSQVCGSPAVGGDQTKCAECETVCGAKNCGCYGTNTDAVCEKFGPLAEGCTNTRSGGAEDSGGGGGEEDNEDSGGGGGSSKPSGMNAKEYTKATTPAQRKAANEKIEALSKYAHSYYSNIGGLSTVPLNWC